MVHLFAGKIIQFLSSIPRKMKKGTSTRNKLHTFLKRKEKERKTPNINPSKEETATKTKPNLTFSRSLITPERQKEQWGAKKQPEMKKKETLPMLTSLPLVRWGGTVKVNGIKYSTGNTCPIGKKK